MSKKNIDNRYISRRQFLIGSGKMVLALPPLISMMPSEVVAAVQNKRVRVITGVSKYGIDPGPRYPSDNLSMNTFSNAVHTRYKAFSEMDPRVSYLINLNSPAFSGLAPKMNLIRGLNLISRDGKFTQGSHGFTVLSGSYSGSESPRYGASIDTIIEQQLGVRAIRLKSDGGDAKVTGFSYWRPSPGANYTVSNHTFGDRSLFNILFPGGSVTTPENDGPSKKRLLIDQVLADLNALSQHRRISNEDRRRLDEYTTSVHEVQKRMIANDSNSQNNVTCGEASINFEQDQSSINYDQLYTNYIELIRLALQCDQARVVHMANSALSRSFSGNAASNSAHHKSNANGNVQADKKRYFLEKMALMAKRLDATIDPFDSEGGTLLDNSIMLWTMDLGAWNTSHSITQIPAVTFGKGGGYFKSGYFADYRFYPYLRMNTSTTAHMYGRPYKQLLISMMQAAGLSANQYLSFGDGSGFGEFSPRVPKSNTDQNAYQVWANEHNNPLPFLSNVS
ncbi:MAG: DUF1552 domain-containing protein [Pseudomonadota bacterium]